MEGLGPSWARLGRTPGKNVAGVNGDHAPCPQKGGKKGAPGEPFWEPKSIKKIVLKFEGAPGMDFRSSRAPSEGKKLYFH